MAKVSAFWTVIIIGVLFLLMIFLIPYERSTRTDNVQWLGFIGKTSRDIAYNVATLSDGIIVAGWTGYGDQNALLVKLSKDGKLIWQKELGGSGTDGAICLTSSQSPKGNGILSSSFRLPSMEQ